MLPVAATALWRRRGCAPPPDAGDAVDAGWILSKLARPAPTRTAFVEAARFDAAEGAAAHRRRIPPADGDTLVRDVRAPYAETTTIRNGRESRIARDGKRRARSRCRARRNWRACRPASARCCPATARSWNALPHRQHAARRQRWTLTLTPTDRAFAAKVRDIVLHGRGAELRCIETTPGAKGDVQRTLLAGAARERDDGPTDGARHWPRCATARLSDVAALCAAGARAHR